MAEVSIGYEAVTSSFTVPESRKVIVYSNPSGGGSFTIANASNPSAGSISFNTGGFYEVMADAGNLLPEIIVTSTNCHVIYLK